jgi:hypothetical protein
MGRDITAGPEATGEPVLTGGESRALVRVLHTVPARKMVQRAEHAVGRRGAFVGQVLRDPLVKLRHRRHQVDLVEISHHVGSGDAPVKSDS